MSTSLRDLVARISFEADTKVLDRVEHRLEGIQSRLEILAAGEILRGIYELAEKFSSFGESLDTAAISAGITVEAFQELSFAASQNAVSQEELSGALGKLARNLSEARDGSKSALDAFAAVGITEDQVAGFANASDAMEALADQVATIDDPIKRTAATMALLGRGSVKMAKFLRQGGAGIRSLKAEAKSMGVVVSARQVEDLAELEDAMSALGLVFKVAGATLASYFAPSIIWLTKAITKFYAANKKAIGVQFEKWAYDITFALGYAYGWFEKITQSVLDLAAAHPDLVRRVGEFILGLAGVSLGISTVMFALSPFRAGLQLVGALLSGLASTAKVPWGIIFQGALLARGAIAKLTMQLGLLIVGTFPALGEAIFAVGAAIGATPVGWLLAGLAALAVAAHDIWVLFHGGDFWKDTWLGQALTALKGLSVGLMKKLGFDPAELDNLKPSGDLKATDAPLPMMMGYSGDAMAPLVDRMRLGIDGAQRANTPPMDMSKFSPATQDLINSGGNQSNTFNANITVNAPPGTDAKQVASLTKNAIQEQFDTMMRNTQRALQSPVRG